MLIGVSGPVGWDPGVVQAEVCLVLPGVVPGAADWHPGAWQAPTAAEVASLTRQVLWVVNSAALLSGEYLAKVRLTSGVQQVVKTSGRVTVE